MKNWTDWELEQSVLKTEENGEHSSDVYLRKGKIWHKKVHDDGDDDVPSCQSIIKVAVSSVDYAITYMFNFLVIATLIYYIFKS